MINSSKNLDLMLSVKGHILKNQDLDMRRKKMKNHPKALKAKFLPVFTILKESPFEKCFSLRKVKK